jgi:hypothetical protein
VDRTNNDLAHVCDISPEVKKSVIWIRAQFGYVVEAIRKAIRALLKALGFDPSGEGSKLVQQLKSLAREIKKFKKYVDDFNELGLELLRLAAQLRAMIDYILSLPEKFLKLLQDCLAKLYAALAKGFADLLASPDLGDDFNTDEIKAAFKDVQTAGQELYTATLTAASLPGQLVSTVLTPSSSEDIEKAGKDLGDFFTSQPAAPDISTTIDASKQP